MAKVATPAHVWTLYIKPSLGGIMVFRPKKTNFRAHKRDLFWRHQWGHMAAKKPAENCVGKSMSDNSFQRCLREELGSVPHWPITEVTPQYRKRLERIGRMGGAPLRTGAEYALAR
ncbi:MAG: hypothetical protein QXI43_00025 [Candidatus Nitrosocaldus sp.]